MKTLADLTNRLLILLDEPGASYGANPAIPAGATFSQAFCTDILNEGINVFLEESGFAPDVSDKYVQLPVTAGQDYALPSDLLALARIEYLQGNNVSATGPSPVYLPQLSFPQFDAETGGAANVAGVPQMYREPFAGKIRFFPYPTAANVTNSDQLFLYYTGNGTALAALTDTISFPPAYAPAIIEYALSFCFQRKRDDAAADMWYKRFLRTCDRAKTYAYNLNQAAELSIGDVENDPDEPQGVF